MTVMKNMCSSGFFALAFTVALLVQVAQSTEMYKRVCEGRTLAITCNDDHAYIHITHALYGRMDRLICYKFYSSLWSTNCRSRTSLSEVQKKCEGKATCSVEATNKVFGDPCFLTEKYLEVKYICRVDGGYSEWSDFDECSKSCGGGSQVRHRSCTEPSPKNGGKDCEGVDTESRSCNSQPCPVNGGYSEWSAYGQCSRKCGRGTQTRTRTCDNPEPAFGGKDCSELGPAESSRLCMTLCPIPAEQSSLACEGKTMSLKCPANSKIIISQAMYGRKERKKCWKVYSFAWDKNCAAPNSLSVVKEKCQGKSSCEISASNQLFGDPCRFTEKYLDVRYRCSL